jgi:hypothetical protein
VHGHTGEHLPLPEHDALRVHAAGTPNAEGPNMRQMPQRSRATRGPDHERFRAWECRPTVSPAFPFKAAAAQSLLLRCQAAALRSRHRHGVLRVTAHRELMTEWQYPTEVTPDGCFAPAVRQARTVRLRSIRALTPVMAPINPPATRVHRLMSRDGTTASLAADRGRDGTLD